MNIRFYNTVYTKSISHKFHNKYYMLVGGVRLSAKYRLKKLCPRYLSVIFCCGLYFALKRTPVGN